MGFFRRARAPRDRITAEALARFGRYDFVGHEAEPGLIDAWGLIRPLAEALQGPTPDLAGVCDELERHADQGPWSAVGGWRFARECITDETALTVATERGMHAVVEMRITNLAFHLGAIDVPHYERIAGEPPPNDGFFGPMTFDSEFGPDRQHYFDQAVAVAADRRPARLRQVPGVDPGPLERDASNLWDFGQLMLRGPLVVGSDVRFEPATVRAAARVASEADHTLFVRRVQEALDANQYAELWSYVGAGRFVEDYLDPALTGSPIHRMLVVRGLGDLLARGMVGRSFTVDALSPFERECLQSMGGERPASTT